MPPVVTSPRLGKKVGIMQKPKGAVRAKSGCYTCRIRRKKCDEKRINGHEDGPCETCYRLKLECLGFGAKRPDWLRENSRVSAIRDRIKAHLAAQGMIKGHAGSGARSNVQEEFLRLSDPRDDDMMYRTGGSSSSTEGSPAREHSVDDDGPYGGTHHRLSMTTSAMRERDGMYDQGYSYFPPHSDIHSRSHSPAAGSSVYDLEPADFSLIPYRTDMESPAIRSSFSKNNLYGDNPQLYIIDELPDEPFDLAKSVSHFYPSEQIPYELLNNSMREYVNNVVKIQYLLGDRDILPIMIWDAIKMHRDSHEAVNLLARAYYGRQNDNQYSVLQDINVISTISSLKGSLQLKAHFTADDAMTALHIVSLYLFDGGRGKWSEFLFFASRYVKTVLEKPEFYHNYPAALEAASAKDQFVVKTTIWFDVLASVTTQQPPVLLTYIRELFRPNRSWVGNPTTYSMLSPMGCENTVVWALAETAELSYWKRRHETQGDLSVRELVKRVQDIEMHLQPGPRPQRPGGDVDTWSRFVASEIFRTSTKLFLKSVESGDFPYVSEVQDCVLETYNAIMEFPAALMTVKSAVVRSTVFGIFICGSLTDNHDMRRVLYNHLLQNSGHEGVGNCTTVSSLLDTMWRERDAGPLNLPVRWREYLNHAQILLV
ncbi:hypothetical protein BDN70DRAFT_927679 [Pholiota conissans]|uniref:Zn(2)-C6 fungal-type domain-containing protein n=1 Tax=Pholiota conissans TaxID=109636 RepID=A0A9P5ZDT3_9AGAR|nr:hypothetical protein BDN70DRAFT_927679 [Pholiota conissans]